MLGNRKKAEKVFMDWLGKITKHIGPKNINLYKDFFKSLSDQAFDELIQKMETSEVILPLFVENMSEVVNVQEIMEVGEAMGVKFFQKLILTDPLIETTYKTANKYLVLELPVRRQSQHGFKKISVPESTKIVDVLSGQVTGVSKGASMSLPELTVLDAKGLGSSVSELIKVRGGDEEAYRHMLMQTEQTGGYSLGPIMELGSRPKATKTLGALLNGMHIRTNL